MSLATTTARLERHWMIEERRNPPWERWAAHAPALNGPPGEIRDRLDDRDRTRSGPVLAALVRLAGGGDQQAALLVTMALLPRMVRAEAHRARGGDRTDNSYEQLAGLLWEAVVTAPNPAVAALRESIERNAWRRKWRSERPLQTVELDVERVERTQRGPCRSDVVADVCVAGSHLRAELQRLESDDAISPTTRRLLEHLAAGSEPTAAAGQSADAARKQRWRTLAQVRQIPAVIEALTA